ncbi:MAG: glucokinase [Geoglossum simile]|nr:MAG: glucokinase [Geoglossum simile]
MQSSISQSLVSQHKIPLLDEARKTAARFSYTDDDVRKCAAEFIRKMNEGLRERTPAMCQIPTYITRAASGTEKGVSLAVDLGGTNLRICSVDLHGDTTLSVLQSRITIPPELMIAKQATELFSFIAKQIEAFLKTYHNSCFSIPEGREELQIFSLGFAFSFPAYQSKINSGVLLRWTKRFDIPDAVGQDVCKLLQDEIDLLHLPVRVTALVNDAAGTIMSRAYSLPVSDMRTSIGAIFGTGTNCVYLEKLSKITKPLEGQYDKSTGEMFISIEWGSFDNHLTVLPNTCYDAELDEDSVNPGNQMFEKRVSGLFLGELLRIAILAMHKDLEIGLFQNSSTTTAVNDKSPLHRRWAVDSSILSIAEADNSDGLVTLREKIEESLSIPATRICVEDAQAVKVIAHAIGKRAARLAGMAIGAVVLQSQRLADPVGPLAGGAGALSSIKDLSRGEFGTDASHKDITNTNVVTNKLVSTTTLQDSSSGPLLYERGIVDIGVDGSVIEFYPGFETYMREALGAIEGIGKAGEERIRIGIAKDGSSVGAAIIAHLAAERA